MVHLPETGIIHTIIDSLLFDIAETGRVFALNVKIIHSAGFYAV